MLLKLYNSDIFIYLHNAPNIKLSFNKTLLTRVSSPLAFLTSNHSGLPTMRVVSIFFKDGLQNNSIRGYGKGKPLFIVLGEIVFEDSLLEFVFILPG